MVTPVLAPSVSNLREVKLLGKLTDPELEQLLGMGTTSEFEAHANIVIEGELSWGIYLILDGMVGVYKTNKISGELYDLGQLRQGSFFGEMSLVDDSPRSATVKALVDCQVFYISKESFNRFLDASTDLKLRFYDSCVSNLIGRLRDLNDNYVISQYQLWKTALAKDRRAA